MKSNTLVCGSDRQMKRARSILGVACVSISALAIVLPFLFAPDLGGKIDLHLRYFVPLSSVLLVVMAVARGERIIWPVIGLILTAIHVGLHLLAVS